MDKTNQLPGGEDRAGAKMKATAGWLENGNGNNASGFAALPGGYCDYDGFFDNIQYNAYFWSATESSSENSLAYYRVIGGSFGGNVSREPGGTPEGNGLSVRCIKD